MVHTLAKGIHLRLEHLPPDYRRCDITQGVIDRTPAATAKFHRTWGGLQNPECVYPGHLFLLEFLENPDQRDEYMAKHHVNDPVGWHAVEETMAPQSAGYASPGAQPPC